MLNKIAIFAVAFLFLATFGASGQNVADTYQEGAENEVYIEQLGSDNFIDLDQIAVNANNADLTQLGVDNNLLAEQNAGDWNNIITLQDGDNNEILLHQEADWNYASVLQVNDVADNLVDITQDGVTGNYLRTRQYRSDAEVTATQKSYSGYNEFVSYQFDDDTILLEQEGDGQNNVYIDQWGTTGNSIDFGQSAPIGYNSLSVVQMSGGATVNGSQTALGGYNELGVTQSTADASATVIQTAMVGNNIATITQ